MKPVPVLLLRLVFSFQVRRVEGCIILRVFSLGTKATYEGSIRYGGRMLSEWALAHPQGLVNHSSQELRPAAEVLYPVFNFERRAALGI